MDSRLINFYRGKATDHAGRFIEEIWNYSFEELEYHHDFIQWIFPLPEQSRVLPEAPLLSIQDQEIFRKDPDLQKRLLRSFILMVNFYGFDLDKTPGAAELVKRSDFRERTANWLNPGNHNFLRITRILRSLCLTGQSSLSRLFLNTLSELHLEKEKTIGSSWYYWQGAVNS